LTVFGQSGGCARKWRNDLESNMSSEEKLWLVALNRGPLSPTSLKRRMPEPLRNTLIAKGLVRQQEELLEITKKGSSLANDLILTRRATANSAR